MFAPNGDSPTIKADQLGVITSPGVLLELEGFLARFETAFGEADWQTTRDCVSCDDLIRPGGTFLEPGVDDESSNWWNRGALLASYRRLKTELETAKFSIGELRFSCNGPTPDSPQGSSTASAVSRIDEI
jgi:hypothetical protein